MTGNLPKLVKDINAQNQKVQNPKKEKKGNNSQAYHGQTNKNER